MKTTRIRIFKFSDSKENLQFHWPYVQYYVTGISVLVLYTFWESLGHVFQNADGKSTI